MKLGTFSVSLAVKDMSASRAFYEKLGFERTGGDGETWTILSDGKTVIGLFHGMFEQNLMTFNPGWEGSWKPAEEFTDVRDLRSEMVAAGIETYADTTADTSEGPASFMITDPDGNQILIDQHV